MAEKVVAEYILNGNILGNNVTIDGVSYPRQAYVSLEAAGEILEVVETPTLSKGQTLNWGSGSVVDGKWQRWTLRDKTDAELLVEVRNIRNVLLEETDFYALSDVAMSDAMTTYRQDLRDFPATVDLTNIVYPDKPGGNSAYSDNI